MKTKILTAASAIAILTAMPALAQTKTSVNAQTQATIEAQKNNNPNTPDMPIITGSDIERGWDNTQDTLSNAAENTGEAIEDTYYNIQNVFTDEDTPAENAVTIKTRTTAKGMIGKNVYNANGESVAKVEDIIMDRNGIAQMVILRDGGLFGMGGKLVAFDYNNITERADSGDIMMPISENLIDKVAEFSYDRNTSRENIRMIPENGISVTKVMDGHIKDPDNKNVADIDNVTLVNGRIEYLVVSFNKVLEMGGDTAVMKFDNLQAMAIDDNKEINFQLSGQQAADFELFKKKAQTKG